MMSVIVMAACSTKASACECDVFKPKEATLKTRFDYTLWDLALAESVVQMGPSLRRFAREKPAQLGSRISFKSRNSPYRLEGSRIAFHYLPDHFVSNLTLYKEDLIGLTEQYDIQSFSRDEQLAFWINLHNVLLIETIAKNHPTTHPSLLVLGSDQEQLHDAKLITIKNIPLSLKNIRENIVYANWANPNVIYGFFRGDIGGPAIVPYAMTAKNVHQVLSLNGFEYITSLRGFHTTKKARKVSQIYKEAQSYFFTNWPADLEAHLEEYLQEHYLIKELNQSKPINFIEYDRIIADLWGGNNNRRASYVNDSNRSISTPPILYERAEKIKELKIKGRLKRNYRVVIEDIDSDTEGK